MLSKQTPKPLKKKKIDPGRCSNREKGRSTTEMSAIFGERARNRPRCRRRIDDLQNYCLGTRRGIAADRGRPAVGFVYIPNGKLVHFIFSLWPFSSQNHAPKGPERKRNKPR